MSPPSSRSASSRPSLSSTRSTPPTDDGESSSATRMAPAPPPPSSSIDKQDEPSIEEAVVAAAAEVALPSEKVSHASAPHDDSEIDAIFEQTASESESPRRPPSIPDDDHSGPRNYSRLTVRDSGSDSDNDSVSGTPPPNPFGPIIRSATLNTAKQVAGDNGVVLPSAVCESPSPTAFSRRRLSSVGTNRGSKSAAIPDFSPFSSKKKKPARSGFPTHTRGFSSPSRKNGRMLQAVAAPSPDPSPLVLLHVTLLPLPAQGPASSVLANHLRKMISPTVVARGLLLPHPNDDYDALVDMVAENLGLDQETPPPFKRAPTYIADDCASHSEGSYIASSDDEADPVCPNCSRRRLKPEPARHGRPRRLRRPFKNNEKWYSINVFASNGLMRAGAWSRSWEEMERIDVEVTVTPGYEDIEPPRSLRPSSQRSESKKTLQGSFQFKRRMPPTMVGVETTTDEEMPRPRRTSGSRRRTSGPRNASGSVRSRNGSNYSKQEPLSELEILPDDDKGKEIFSDGLDTDVPIFEPPEQESGTFVPIWEDKDAKEGEEAARPERMRSEDAWTTDEEPSQNEVKPEVQATPPSETGDLAPGDKTDDENRRLSAFTMNTAIHHTIASSSRGTSLDRDLLSPSENLSPEPEIITPAVSPPLERKVTNPHRLHPSSRRGSREIKPAELVNYPPSEKTASRPNSSRVPDNMAIVGLAISDDSDEVPEDLEGDKENHHDSVDNKENIPVDISDEDEPAANAKNEYPADDEDPEELRPVPSPRSRRAVTPKTAGPSPMPSRFSSPAISPDISPIVSRANSPQPPKPEFVRQRRRRSSRKSFDRNFESRGHSRINSSTSDIVPIPSEESPRGRSVSRSTRRSMTPSPEPRSEKELDPEPPEGLVDKMRLMIKPTIDTLSSIPLPTLLLIAIPFAALIAFSVNSYVQQRNLDFMVRNFMETQVAQQMQMLQQQQQVVPAAAPPAVEVEAPFVPPVQVVNPGGSAEAEKVLADVPEPVLSPEEQAELDWRNAQKKGLEHESVVYGIQVGGKCVMPQEVAAAIRQAARERDGLPHDDDADDTEGPLIPTSDEVVDAASGDEEGVDFGSIVPEADEEERPRTPVIPAADEVADGDSDVNSPRLSQYETPPRSPRRFMRERSRERKTVPTQPYDYYHQPVNVPDEYDRLSDAGDIDVGKAQVRDGGLEDGWFAGDIPEMSLPPPLREVPASPSRVHAEASEVLSSDVPTSEETEVVKEDEGEGVMTGDVEGEEEVATVQPGSLKQQVVGDRPRSPSRNGRGRSPSPARPRPSSRGGSKSRSRSRGRKSPVLPSAVPQEPEIAETEVAEYEPLNLHKDEERPVTPDTAQKESPESWKDRFFERLLGGDKDKEKEKDKEKPSGKEEADAATAAVGEDALAGSDATVASPEASSEEKLEVTNTIEEVAVEEGEGEVEDGEGEEEEEEEMQQFIPENLMTEEYVFEDGEEGDDEEEEEGDGDGEEVEGEEFDYEGLLGSLKEGWWEEERR
ncbi:hypothetical protein Dda_2272 [Drechslerella dactyloides]|uniref:Uncharacterized protein n=1 Tax=Drechslerella dactyloides TaxID=74499 RepID=A0AAD6J3D4_DREDA|nr:hypothetical protein Dda_2272 [Drechslerella dactyloides]